MSLLRRLQAVYSHKKKADLPFPAFIDLHSHVLPGIDDGAQNTADALEMLRMAEEEGITDMVCTPHFLPGTQVFHNHLQEAALHSLQIIAESAGLSIRLHPGNELHFDKKLPEYLENGVCMPLANSRYILLELPLTLHPHHAQADIANMVEGGWTPIVAHTERIHAIQQQPELIESLVDAGCLIQVNASAFTESSKQDTAKTAKALLALDAIDIVASDCHSTGRRAPHMREAYLQVQHLAGTSVAERLFHQNPQAILADGLRAKSNLPKETPA